MIAIFTLLATAGLLAACGSSSHRSNAKAASDTATPGTSRGASKSLTKAQAIAFAHEVNLTAADVPGFKVSVEHREHETATEKRLEHEVMRCAGGTSSPSGELAEVSSKDFKLEHNVLDLGVSSEVSVARTPALAAEGLAAIRGSRVRGCLSRYLDLLFKTQKLPGATVGPVSISQGTPPAPGTTGSFGWRITATIDARRLKLPFYLDILGFVYGSAEVTLDSSGALRPFPAAVQQHLFLLLLKRAEAHG